MGVFERVRRVKSLGFWESGLVWRGQEESEGVGVFCGALDIPVGDRREVRGVLGSPEGLEGIRKGPEGSYGVLGGRGVSKGGLQRVGRGMRVAVSAGVERGHKLTYKKSK